MADDIKKTFLFSSDLPPVGPNNTHTLRYRIVSEDGVKMSAWSPFYTVFASTVTAVANSLSSPASSTYNVTWGDENGRPVYDVFVAPGHEILSMSVASNVVTVNTKSAHGFKVGDIVDVSVTGPAALSAVAGTNKVITQTPSALSFRYDASSANVITTTPTGTASVFGAAASTDAKTSNYYYHGSPTVHTYSFLVDANVRSAQVIIQIASLAKELDSSLEIARTARVVKTV